MNYDEFNGVELTPEYKKLGEKLKNPELRKLIELIEKIPALLYTSATGNGQVTNDIYGNFSIQSLSQEDRLLFRNNHAHVHIQWSTIKTAKLHRSIGHPQAPEKHWVGIVFSNHEDVELFSIWNVNPDMPFNDSILMCLEKMVAFSNRESTGSGFN